MTVNRQQPWCVREAGFTLVEMLVVLAILAITMGVVASLPAARSPTQEAELRLHALRIAGSLKAARAAAISTGREVAFIFNARENSWAIEEIAAPVRLPEGLTLKLETDRIAIVSDDDARLVFFPDGSATGGSVALALGARRVVITVAWINGAASLPGMPR